MKVLAINDALHVILEESVQFDTDLPEFKTKGNIASLGVNLPEKTRCVIILCLPKIIRLRVHAFEYTPT